MIVISAIVVSVVATLGALLGLLGGLYWLASKLPKKWQEGSRSWVFLLPAMVAMIIGLVIPAIRTIYLSLLDDNGDDVRRAEQLRRRVHHKAARGSRCSTA